ncbi:MAG: hypothetical protein AAFY65_16055 [Pseudomonadota bacterium]
MRTLFFLLCVLLAGTGPTLAHEVTVDVPFTPREEVAGVDVPPYPLRAFYEGEVGPLFARSDCYVSQDRLRTYALGAWMELPTNARRERLVCAILMMSGGPQRILQTGARTPNPDVVRNTTLGVFVLAETFRAPYNLSAVEGISSTLVVLGLMSPTNRRALLRAVLEE